MQIAPLRTGIPCKRGMQAIRTPQKAAICSILQH